MRRKMLREKHKQKLLPLTLSSMKEKIEQILNDVRNFQAENKEALENFRITYLSKKGVIPSLFADFKNVAPELRKEMGMRLNELKNSIGAVKESASPTVMK